MMGLCPLLDTKAKEAQPMKNTGKILIFTALAALVCLTACENSKNSDSSQVTTVSQTAASESSLSDSSIVPAVTSETVCETTTTTSASASATKQTTSASTSVQTTSASTSVQKTTTSSSQTGKKKTESTPDSSASDKKQSETKTGKVGVGNYKLSLYDMDGYPKWQFRNMYTDRWLEADVSASLNTELYSIDVSVIENPPTVKEDGRVSYKDIFVPYQIIRSQQLKDTKLFDSIVCYYNVAYKYTVRLEIELGGKYRLANYSFAKDGSPSAWLAKNADKYSSVSSDPKDYLFVLDHIDLNG